jgi:PAS domain S-box-containing protein
MGIIVAFGLHGQAVLARRKREKGRLRTAYRFLEIANRHRRMAPMLEEFVSAVKEFTGCDSAGIRILGEEGNIPYQAYEGFSQEFYDSESSLSIKLDRCMCINVIKGATEPKPPYYTQVGSFYTNSNTRLLATVSEAERGPNRNVCKLYGYETVVLVPINLAGRILGLIHVADHREGMVTLEKVEALEEVAIQLGTAIQRVWAEEELQESEERNRALLDLGTEVGESVVLLQDSEQGEGVQTFISYMWPHITGYAKEELLGMSFFDLVHPENRQSSIERHRKKMAGKSMPGLYELSIVRKDGTEVPVELTSTSTTYKGQRANVVFIRDIAERGTFKYHCPTHPWMVGEVIVE